MVLQCMETMGRKKKSYTEVLTYPFAIIIALGIRIFQYFTLIQKKEVYN